VYASGAAFWGRGICPLDRREILMTPILCVHTDDRPDRRANVDAQAERYGLTIEVVSFSKDRDDPVRGCCTSHLHVLRMARERRYESVVVVENDVDFVADPRPWWGGPRKLPWDVCHPGGTLSRVVMDAPAALTDATAVAILEVGSRSFEAVDAEIADSTAEVVVLLPAVDEHQDSSARVRKAFREVDSSVANAYVDTAEGGRALRVSVATYGRARVGACLAGESIVGTDSLVAILERLMEVTHCVVTSEAPLGPPSALARERRAWLPATVLSTHCYVMWGRCLDEFIGALESNLESDRVEPVDVVFCRLSEGKNVYLLKDPVALQVPCYSNVERQQTDYRKVQSYTLPEYPVNHERRSIRAARTKNDGLTLALFELDDMPLVSVLTITRNRRRRFALAVNNFLRIDYPADRLQWVVVDDSDEGMDARPSLDALRRDPRVCFVKATTFDGKPLSIGAKRQLACQHARGDVFFHMNDDDYVPAHAVKARVKSLRTYAARCVGSTSILCFDVRSRELFTWASADVFGDLNVMPEASLAYDRSFWEERGWDERATFEEWKEFSRGRLKACVSIPSQFSIIAITHVGNFTGDLPRAHRVHASMRTKIESIDIFPDDFDRLLKRV
jgi:hypothetical protein